MRIVLKLILIGIFAVLATNSFGQNVMQFAATAGPENNQGYTKVVADKTGGFTAIGYFENKVYIDDGFTLDSINSRAASRDAFFIYFDSRTVSKDLFAISGNGFESINDAAYNSNNELLHTGVFTDSLFLDPATNLPFTKSAGSNDIFLVKYNSNRQFGWGKTIGSLGYEDVVAIEMTPKDEFYLVGFYSGSLDFDPDTSSDIKTPTNSQEVFISKYDSSGNYLWTKTFGGRGFANVNDVHYANGYLYMCGQYSDSIDFDPDSIGIAMEYASTDDVFVLKLDSNANFEWVKTFGGPSLDVGQKITTDLQGNVYTAGEFRGRVDFDPGSNSQFVGTSGAEDVFIQRLNANGNFVWVNKYIGYNNERARALLFNPQDQSLLVGGTFNGTAYFSVTPILLRFSNGSNDAFIHKLDRQRRLLWFENFGESGTDNIADMCYDAFGNLIAVGDFRDSIKWNGPNGTERFYANGTDGFIVKYDRQLVGNKELTEESHNQLKVYPNPVNKLLNIDLNFKERVTISISDINGKTLFQGEYSENYLQIEFPFPKGIYILKVQSPNELISRKIIRQ